MLDKEISFTSNSKPLIMIEDPTSGGVSRSFNISGAIVLHSLSEKEILRSFSISCNGVFPEKVRSIKEVGLAFN